MTQKTFAADESNQEQHRDALLFVTEAFAEAILAGIESDSFARAALEAALQELVAIYGEEHVATVVADLPGRIRAGQFTLTARH